MSIRAVVKGWGACLPKRVMDNDELSTIVDTTDEWISQRTGIKQRHICSDDEGAISLSVGAGRAAMQRSGLNAEDIDLLVVATVTGDYLWPSTACHVQHELGLVNAGAFDLGAACAGFIYGSSVASAHIESGMLKNVLVIGVDVLSKQLDWTDRSTCVLFGDAAAGVVYSAEPNSDRGILKTFLRSDGSGAHHIRIDLGGTKFRPGREESKNATYALKMNGAETYRFAIAAMGEACERVLLASGLTTEDIDLFVPHQANLRIIRAAAERLKLPDGKVFTNVQKYGNTSASSIPLALADAADSGVLKPGMKVLTVGFGAGLVWGANVIIW
jgi:3-oxoacyl-[acyl-carrier-protein] synthase-3